MFGYELGAEVQAPDYVGLVMARAEYWDGRRKYLVREIAQSEAPPAQGWLLEHQLAPARDDPPDDGPADDGPGEAA